MFFGCFNASIEFQVFQVLFFVTIEEFRFFIFIFGYSLSF